MAPSIGPRSFGTFEEQGPVSRKSRKLFGPERPFVKLQPAYSVRLVFSYVVKGIKIKITAKFRASRRFLFEDTKIIMSPEMCPKSFGTFEKQAPGPRKQITGKNSKGKKLSLSNFPCCFYVIFFFPFNFFSCSSFCSCSVYLLLCYSF